MLRAEPEGPAPGTGHILENDPMLRAEPEGPAPGTGHILENDPMLRAEPEGPAPSIPARGGPVWAYSTKGAVRDSRTLTLQENRAKAVIAGEKPARTPRFVKNQGGDRVLDAASLARTRRLVGLKGYVTNMPAQVMPAAEVIAS